MKRYNQFHIGRTRFMLASMISQIFETYIDPSKLLPNQGYWRTGGQDVYRWESWLPVGKDGVDVNVCCWDRMTDCVKNGVGFQHDGFIIFVFALGPDESEIGKEQRKKARKLLGL